MDCFVQNVILFHCNEKLLCKMHLCKIDFWLIWVIFQDMIRRMIRRAMFPVYSRVIKAWLASSCAPLLLLHQRPVLFCVCFKKFKHIGLEGGWAGLGWPRASDHLLVGVEASDSWQLPCFPSSLQTSLFNCFWKKLWEIFFHIRKMNNTIFIQPSFGCLATRAGHRYQQWLAWWRLELSTAKFFTISPSWKLSASTLNIKTPC